MGMSESESQKLIWELIEHCAKPEYTFELEWQNAGDLVWYVDLAILCRGSFG